MFFTSIKVLMEKCRKFGKNVTFYSSAHMNRIVTESIKNELENISGVRS